MKISAYAILVTWTDGNAEYVCEGLTANPALFTSRADAKAQADFLRFGMDGDEDFEDIAIVPFPKLPRKSRTPPPSPTLPPQGNSAPSDHAPKEPNS